MTTALREESALRSEGEDVEGWPPTDEAVAEKPPRPVRQMRIIKYMSCSGQALWNKIIQEEAV